MKNQLHTQLSITLKGAFLTVLLLTNCSSYNNTPTSSVVQQKRIDPGVAKNLVLPNEIQPTTYAWEDLLRQVPGVSVQGQGIFLSVRIRGAASLNLTTEPLFVLEGVPLGHEFSSLARIANPRDVKSIYVMKGPEAAFYGARGSNGVVIVTLR